MLLKSANSNTVPTPDQIHREIINSAHLHFSQGPSLFTMTKETILSPLIHWSGSTTNHSGLSSRLWGKKGGVMGTVSLLCTTPVFSVEVPLYPILHCTNSPVCVNPETWPEKGEAKLSLFQLQPFRYLSLVYFQTEQHGLQSHFFPSCFLPASFSSASHLSGWDDMDHTQPSHSDCQTSISFSCFFPTKYIYT